VNQAAFPSVLRLCEGGLTSIERGTILLSLHNDCQ
jgi:hypothetical protein